LSLLRVPVGCVTYTSPRYGSKMHEATKRSVAARLKRIEGQVGGVIRMVDDDRYCVDLLTQINAVRAALHKVEEQILRDHVSHCIADAFVSGDAVEQRHKVEELVDTIGRMTR
jgi:DNA-binding FrmR family transcriptional regulator